MDSLIAKNKLEEIDWEKVGKLHAILGQLNEVTSCVTSHKSVSVGTALLAIQYLHSELEEAAERYYDDQIMYNGLVSGLFVIKEYLPYYQKKIFFIGACKSYTY